MRKQRITLFTTFLNGGGAEKVIINLLNEFQKEEINTQLWLVNKIGELLPEVPKSTQIINFAKSRTIFCLFKLVENIRKTHPESLLIIGDEANIVALLAKKLWGFKTKIFITTHHVNSIIYKHNITIKKYIIFLLIKHLYKKADKIIAVSDGVSKDLKFLLKYPVDITVINNPVDLETVRDLGEKRIEHGWFEKKKYPVILSIGRLVKEKDFSNLINAFSILRKILKVKLIILGNGEEKTNLNKLIKRLNLENDIEIINFNINPYKYLKNASVFVCSSITEGFSLVIVESLALGVSVVSTKCKYGPPEILNYGEYGALVPVNNPVRLSKAIHEVLKNPFEKSKLYKRAEEYSSDTIAKKYLQNICLY